MNDITTEINKSSEALNMQEQISQPPPRNTDVHIKKPKRVLHFSDGIMEEFSSEEDETDTPKQEQINPTELKWGPWFWYQTSKAGEKTLNVMDAVGESLASFFGITTPKYQFEINEYYRTVRAEEEAKKRQDLEMGGWGPVDCSEVIRNQYASDSSPVRALVEPIQNNIKTVPPSSNQGQKY